MISVDRYQTCAGLPPYIMAFPRTSLKPSYERGGYLAFLGRLAPEKGPDLAVRIAQRANMPLRIAAKLPRRHSRYFKERLQPLIDASRTELVGEVDELQKRRFFAECDGFAFSHRLARAVRPGDDRSHGLRDTGHCLPAWIGAGKSLRTA